MDALSTVRMFCDGQMSLFDIRALVESMGVTREEFTAAVTTLSAEEDSSMRVGRYQKGELQAELYLTASR